MLLSVTDTRLAVLLASRSGVGTQTASGFLNPGLNGEKDVDLVVADMLDWPDNIDWLLVFGNVDQDYEHGSEMRLVLTMSRGICLAITGPVLITTRMAQLGDSRRLRNVDEELSKAIFQRWYGRELRYSTIHL